MPGEVDANVGNGWLLGQPVEPAVPVEKQVSQQLIDPNALDLRILRHLDFDESVSEQDVRVRPANQQPLLEDRVEQAELLRVDKVRWYSPHQGYQVLEIRGFDWLSDLLSSLPRPIDGIESRELNRRAKERDWVPPRIASVIEPVSSIPSRGNRTIPQMPRSQHCDQMVRNPAITAHCSWMPNLAVPPEGIVECSPDERVSGRERGRD